MAIPKHQQDKHRQAVELYEDAKEAWAENHARMLEDLKFSNPADDSNQWDAESRKLRRGRVTLSFDRTNQYKTQVVNEARKNKPAITTAPADSKADIAVAKRIDGMIRHIEYASRAAIAYDTAVMHAADCGVGWFRITPRVIKQYSNHQEIRIERVADPLSIVILNSTEPDGSDATNGFAETMMPRRQFKAEYPKCDISSWNGYTDWSTPDCIKICEHQYVVDEEENWITIGNPETGEELDLSEDDYWELAGKIGYKPEVLKDEEGRPRTFKTTKRKVMWQKLSGSELLQETEFPAPWIGMVPVIGYETFIEGKRFLCGLTRRLRSGQIAYNYERSAGIEQVALQPKAPILVAVAAVDQNNKAAWENMNRDSPAYLPWIHKDDEGNPVPMPSRLSPPTLATAYQAGAQMALADMEAAVGITRTGNLGAPSSESGIALRTRKESGDTATYHFPNNESLSIEHGGRIVVAMLPRVYDTKRFARILGVDGQHGEVMVNPELGQAVRRKQDGTIAEINLGVGQYDVRVKAGPSYTTQREAAADNIAEMLRSAPGFTPILGPALMKLRDAPDAEKYARMMIATLPPNLQQIANEGDDDNPAAKANENEQLKQALTAMQQQIAQMSQMLDAGEQEIQRLELENQSVKADKSIEAEKHSLEVVKAAAQVETEEAQDEVDWYRAETERLKLLTTPGGKAP